MPNELQHHGIKGMRWGVRRYQNKDGTRTAAGLKRYNTGKPGTSKKQANDKAKRKRKSSISSLFGKKQTSKPAEEMTDQQKKDDYEAAKQKAVKSGSAADVLKFKGDLTPQEMQSAISRIRWEQDMKSISDKDVVNSKKGVENYVNGLNKAVDVVTTTSKAYNTFANLYNAFSGTDKPMLPKIELNNSNGNRNQRKAEEKERKKAEKEAKAAEKESKKDKSNDDVTTSKSDKSEKSNYSSNSWDNSYNSQSDTNFFKVGKKESKSSTSSTFDWKDISDVADVKITTISDSNIATKGKTYITNALNDPKFDTSNMFDDKYWK